MDAVLTRFQRVKKDFAMNEVTKQSLPAFNKVHCFNLYLNLITFNLVPHDILTQ